MHFLTPQPFRNSCEGTWCLYWRSNNKLTMQTIKISQIRHFVQTKFAFFLFFSFFFLSYLYALLCSFINPIACLSCQDQDCPGSSCSSSRAGWELRVPPRVASRHRLSSVLWRCLRFAQELPVTSGQNLPAWRHLSAYSVHLVNAAVCIEMKLSFLLSTWVWL